MSWISIVLWIVMNAPKLIGLITQLIDLVKGLPHADQLSHQQQIALAIQSGHPEAVEQALNQCIGAACPANVVAP